MEACSNQKNTKHFEIIANDLATVYVAWNLNEVFPNIYVFASTSVIVASKTTSEMFNNPLVPLLFESMNERSEK